MSRVSPYKIQLKCSSSSLPRSKAKSPPLFLCFFYVKVRGAYVKTHDLKYCEMQNKKNAGPGPPDDDSPTEPPDPAHTTAIITLSKTELNHSANNLTNHHTKDHNNHDYSPRQGSLTNSTGSERESDSAYVCDSESPNDNLPPDNDVFDWWFHRNTRGSHKSRYTIIFDAHLFPPDE